MLKKICYKILKINENISPNINIYKIHLAGKNGLEIGGPSNIFNKSGQIPIYSIFNNLDCVNFSDNTLWNKNLEESQTFRYGRRRGYQYICDITDMAKLKSESYDFILCSHVLEHIANPIKAINEMLRILKKDGYLLLLLPDKNYTFDHNREYTSFQHLLDDYNNQIGEDDLSHMGEILEKHDLSMDLQAGDMESFKIRSLKNYHNRALHQHVFSMELLKNIIDYFGMEIILMETLPPFHTIMFAKKGSVIADR
jgi:SAM-dependent methyltransferase